MLNRKNIIWICFSLSFLIGCSTPSRNDSISWHAKYVLPLIQNKFSLVDIFKPAGNSALGIREDTLCVGDTLHLAVVDTVVNQYAKAIISLKDTTFSTAFGALRLCNIPKIVLSLEVPPLVAGFLDIPLPDSLPVSGRDSTTIPYFQEIVIDSSSSDVSLEIENASQNITFKKIAITLLCSGSVLTKIDTVPLLLPNSKIQASLNLPGKRIGGKLSIQCTALIEKGSVIRQNDQFVFSIALNGLAIAQATILDSLFNFPFEVPFKIPLSEKYFRLNYIDISIFSVPFSILNHSELDVQLSAVLGHLWDKNYCKVLGIDSIESLSRTLPDSSYFRGTAFQDLCVLPYTDASAYQNIPLMFSNIRMLGQWNNGSGLCEIPVLVKGKKNVQGKMITISKNDFITLKIQQPQIAVSRLLGYYTDEKIFNGKEKRIRVAPKGFDSVFAAVRGKLRLLRSDVSLNISFLISDSTYIKQTNYTGPIYRLNDTSDADTMRWTMYNTRKDTSQTFQFNLQKLINQFPDSLGYLVDYAFEKFNPIFFDSGSISNSGNSSSIKLSVKSIMGVTLYMAWGITDTVHMVLNATKSKLPLAAWQLKALKNESLFVSFKTINQSGLSGSVFGLGSSSLYHDELNQLTSAEIKPAILTSGKAEHLIPVLGGTGIVFPARGDSVQNVAHLSTKDMQNLSESDSLYVRWGVTLTPDSSHTVKALTDNDYIYLEGELQIEGIQSTNDFAP